MVLAFWGQAMALAMFYPEPGEHGRGKKVSDEILKKLESLGKSRHAAEQRLSPARAVLRWSRTKAEAVLAGNEHLDAVA